MIKDKNAGGQILATAGSKVAIDAVVVSTWSVSTW